ncbi:hypothetical protein F4782DRAFT_525778 [Xylaria castorea]|nr:hypothetical protein F4782DRAFT_525778 [Xylaria castorea]
MTPVIERRRMWVFEVKPPKQANGSTSNTSRSTSVDITKSSASTFYGVYTTRSLGPVSRFVLLVLSYYSCPTRKDGSQPPSRSGYGLHTVFLFEELGLNYEIKSFRFDDIKKKPFIDINPTGRVPAIEDPNTDLALWESGAIYQYLAEVYDTNKRLSYETLKEKHLCNEWTGTILWAAQLVQPSTP